MLPEVHPSISCYRFTLSLLKRLAILSDTTGWYNHTEHHNLQQQSLPLLCYNHFPSGQACFTLATTGRSRLRWSFQEINLFSASALSIITEEQLSGDGGSAAVTVLQPGSKKPPPHPRNTHSAFCTRREVNCCYATSKRGGGQSLGSTSQSHHVRGTGLRHGQEKMRCWDSNGMSFSKAACNACLAWNKLTPSR